MSEARSRTAVIAERLALLVGSPLVFLLLAEIVLAVSGIDTDVARNEDAQIALPVWLLADEVWVADRQSKMERSGGEPIAAADVAWLYHFEEARWIGYKMKPNIAVQAVNPFNPVEVDKGVTFRLASNSAGFRDHEFAPKPSGTLRIVTLGDSSTFGWGAEPEHTYQRLLEERLETALSRDVEVLNLGIPGHNTAHGLGILRHWALDLDPDIVIVSFGANDPRWVPTATAEVLAADDTFMGAARFALLELRTYRMLRKLVFTLANPLRADEEVADASDDAVDGGDADVAGEAPAAPGAGRSDLVRAVDLDAYQANLEEFIDTTAGEADAATIFLSVCTSERAYAATMREVATARDIPALDVRALFSEHIDALEAGELYPEMVDHYRQLYGNLFEQRRAYAVTSDGCHPHRVGHSLIADALVPLVRQALGQPALSSTAPGESQ